MARSQAQKKAAEKLKKKMAEAKKIRKDHPGKPWKQCVKEAFA